VTEPRRLRLRICLHDGARLGLPLSGHGGGRLHAHRAGPDFFGERRRWRLRARCGFDFGTALGFSGGGLRILYETTVATILRYLTSGRALEWLCSIRGSDHLLRGVLGRPISPRSRAGTANPAADSEGSGPARTVSSGRPGLARYFVTCLSAELSGDARLTAPDYLLQHARLAGPAQGAQAARASGLEWMPANLMERPWPSAALEWLNRRGVTGTGPGGTGGLRKPGASSCRRPATSWR